MKRGLSGKFYFKLSKKNVIFLALAAVFFGIVLVHAAPILDQLHLNIQTTDGSGNVVTGTYNFVFNISTTQDCSNVVYSKSATLTTDSRGIISYYLNNTGLNYENQYYLCYYRNGVLIDSSSISRTPYSFTAKNVSLSGVLIDSNLNMGSHNVSATYFFGSGRFLTDINTSSLNLSQINYWTKSGSYLYYNGGNVGIGTTSPGYKLDVSGGNTRLAGDQILIGASDAGPQYLYFDGVSNGLIGWQAATPRFFMGGFGNTQAEFDFYTNGTSNAAPLTISKGSAPTLRLAGNLAITGASASYFTGGNVGIGTTSPTNKLEISSSSGGGLLKLSNTAYGVGLQNIDFANGGSTPYTYATIQGGYTSGGIINFQTSPGDSTPVQTRMTIVNTGNVGIGTTSPANKLEVNGAVVATGGYSATTNAGAYLYDSGGISRLVAFGSGGGVRPLYLGGSNITFNTGSGSYATNMFIGSNGNVGIGTTSPTSKLQVAGNVNAYNYLVNGTPVATIGSANITSTGSANYVPKFTSSNNIGNSVIYQNGGNVGIGTTNPTDSLTISKGVTNKYTNVNDAGIYFSRTSDGSLTGSVAYDSNSMLNISSNGGSASYAKRIVFNVGSSPAGYFNGEGDFMASNKVGIGLVGSTVTPSYPLDVNGTVRATNFIGNGSQLTGVNASNSNTLGGHPASFFMPLNKSVSGQFDFNGGWTNSGLSIIGGNLYAQQGYFYQINSLAVSNLAVNGSLIPPSGFNNQFDLGSSSLRWRNLYLGTNAYIGGAEAIGYSSPGTAKLAVNGNVGIGTTSPTSNLDVGGSSPSFEIGDKINGNNGVYYGGYSNGFLIGVWNGNPWAGTTLGNNSLGVGGGAYIMGKVGIGYSNPGSAKLAVNGNVGIGTTAPGYLLTLVKSDSSANPHFIQMQNTAPGGSLIYLGVGATGSQTGAGTFYISDSSAYDFVINTTSHNIAMGYNTPGTARLAINGNVGIGTTSPGEPLDVNGAIRTNNQLVSTVGTGTAPLAVSSSTEVTNLNANYLEGHPASYFATSSGLGNYVPYTGATADVNLGSHTLTTTGAITGNTLISTVATGTSPLTVSSTTQVNNLNANYLGGHNYAYFSEAAASSQNSVISSDTRSINYQPQNRSAGLYVDFKSNSVDGLYDGGSYNGVLTFRSYGSGTDLSGGEPIQIAYTANGNLWTRLGTSATSWGTWYKVWTSGNDGPGSGLNADLLDGFNSSYFATASSLGSYVPYTGATANVDLNNKNLVDIAKLSVGSATASSTGVAYFNGNVGIGTTNPGYRLETDGALGINAATPYIGMKFTGTGNENLALIGQTINANQAAFEIGTVPSYGGAYNYNFYHDNNKTYMLGYVGIGTTAPAGKLEIYGANQNGNANPLFKLYDTNTGQMFVIDNGNSANDFRISTFMPGSGTGTGNLELQSGSNGNQVVLSNNGNVGIGTATPGVELDVNGIIRTNNQLISTVSTGTAPLAVSSSTEVTNLNANYLEGHPASYFATATSAGVSSVSNSDGSLTISPTTGAVVASLNTGHSNTWSAAQTFNAGITSSGITNNGNLIMNRYTIYLAGSGDLNHAIGNGLETYGGSTDGETFDFNKFLDFYGHGAGAGSSLFINGTTGNIGIGSTSPGSYKLLVNGALHTVASNSGGGGNLASTVYDLAGYSIGSQTLYSYGAICAGNSVGQCSGNGGVELSAGSTSGTPYTSIPTSGNTYFNNGGNVGIGTTSPGQKLEVNGNAQIDGQLIPSTSSNTGGGPWYFGSSAWPGDGPAVSNIDSSTGLIYTGSSGSQLYTLSSNSGQASFQLDGSIFIGDNGGPYNPFGITGSSDGYLLVDNSASIGGSLDVNGPIATPNQLISTVGTGTSPLTVSSTTQVNNLNANYLQGHNASYFATAGSGVTSISNSDGSLTISPTTGAAVASLNVGHANTWTAAQTFNGGISTSSQYIAVDGGSSYIGDGAPTVPLTSSTSATAYSTGFYSASLYSNSGYPSPYGYLMSLSNTGTRNAMAQMYFSWTGYGDQGGAAGQPTYFWVRTNRDSNNQFGTWQQGVLLQQNGDLNIGYDSYGSGNAHFSGSVGIGTTGPGNLLDINTNSINSGIDFNGAVALTGTTSDGWLRLNNQGSFSNGVYTPGFLRVDGGIASGSTGTPGAGNIVATGNVGSSTIGLSSTLTQNDGYDYTQLAQYGFCGSHALLFGAYATTGYSSCMNGVGNTKYAYGAGSYNYGAGAIMYFANGGAMSFYVSPVSTGAGQNVSWGTPILELDRGGTVKINGVSLNYNANVNSVSSSDSSLSISPTTGAVIANLNVGHANTWSAAQTFSGITDTGTSSLGGGALVAGNTNEIWTQPQTNGVATLWVNYRGYSGGTTQTRNFEVGNGKAGAIFYLDGAAGNSWVNTGGYFGIGNTAPAYALDVSGDIHATGWVRTDGTNGWYSQTYGGGWYMSDTSWIRTYNSKNVWTNTGLLGSQGGLTIGYGGASPPSGGGIFAGSVGIGTTAPGNLLDINTGSTTSGIDFNGGLAISGTTSDGWLRLNQNGNFGNGVYTPGFLRADGGIASGGIGSPGGGNIVATGNIAAPTFNVGSSNTQLAQAALTVYNSGGTSLATAYPLVDGNNNGGQSGFYAVNEAPYGINYVAGDNSMPYGFAIQDPRTGEHAGFLAVPGSSNGGNTNMVFYVGNDGGNTFQFVPFNWDGTNNHLGTPVFTIGAQSGNAVATGTIQGTQLISTVSTGTAPLAVSSSTEVTNLNANYLEGHPASDFALASGLGNYVPYTGATTTVNLGSQALTTTGAITAGTFNGNLNGYVDVQASNEMTLANGFAGGALWLNYRGASGSGITQVNIGNGLANGGLASIDTAGITNNGNLVNSGYISITGSAGSAGDIRFSTANPYITASSYIVMPGGLYVSGGTLYAQNQMKARGGIANDNAAYLELDGGTSGITYVNGQLGVGTSTVTSGDKLDVGGTGPGGAAIYGYDSSGSGYGVFGKGKFGIYGDSTSSSGAAIYGYADASNYAVYGNGPIYGTSTITAANYVESTLAANNALYAPNGAVYAGGASYNNYFAGNVGIGTTDNTGGLTWVRGTPKLAVLGNGIWSNYGAVFTGDIATYPNSGGALRVGWVSNTMGLVQALMNGADANLQLEGSTITLTGGTTQIQNGVRVSNAGTTTHQEQRGQVTIGTSSANEKSVSFRFSNTFSSTPYMTATPDSTSTATDAFAVSAYNISTTGFSVHIVRIDGGGPGWGQSLRMDYIAWN